MVNQMAYVNVAEWSPEHVSEWLRGLEYSLLPYVQFFLNNEIDGHHLLNLTANDLEDLHIFKIGHQQLILEAVELLRQLHYSLNSETLQSLSVKLSCRARSLHNDLKINGPRDHSGNIRQERISTHLLSSVSEVLTSVKTLVSWLDRPPFQHDPLCIKLRKTVLKLSIELASTTQRDQFAELPHVLIKKNSACIAELCDQFIQNSMDSLILQPASLDFAMIKKRIDEELGIHIKSTYSGVHIIGGIKDQSPAKSCNKVECGDEIVQVNYQTVIGWQQKKLVTTMTEHSSELQLTLKKRPRHLNLLGEIIILKPYRIPSKKTAKQCSNWSEDRHQLSVPEINPKSEGHGFLRNKCHEDDDDDAFLPTSSSELILTKELLFQSRFGTAVQRRATVSGAYPILLQSPVSIEELVNGIFYTKSTKHFSPNHPIKNKNAINASNSKRKEMQANERDFTGIQNLLNSNESFPSDDSPNRAFKTILEDASETSSKSNFCLPLDLTEITEASLRKFHGHGHYISDEIAENKEMMRNPVIFRKASKLEENMEEKSCHHPDDMNSYQVVIVGGVPQKSIPLIKGEKKKNFDLFINPHNVKKKLSQGCRSRYISCSDLGQGDCAGWLYKQKEKKGFFPATFHWNKRWIILKDHYLFCYKDKSDNIAECLISLPGSIVSLTSEYKSKKFVFKISREQMNFYLASESQKDLTIWMNKVRLAAIACDATIHFKSSSFFNTDAMLSIPNNFDSDETMTSHRFKNVHLLSKERNSLSEKFHNSVDSVISINQLLPTLNKLQRDVTTGKEMNFSSLSNFNHTHNSDTSMNCTESFTDAGLVPFRNSFNCEPLYHNDKIETSVPGRLSEKCKMSASLDLSKKSTPGLIARLAVSYTNVSGKNAKKNLLPGVESFPSKDPEKRNHQSCICASENNSADTYPKPLTTNSLELLDDPSQGKNFTSFLDKEYHKVFEKVSHLESSISNRKFIQRELPNDHLSKKFYSLTVNQNNRDINTSSSFTKLTRENNSENKMIKIVSLPDKKMTANDTPESCSSSTQLLEDTLYSCDSIGFTLKDSDNFEDPNSTLSQPFYTTESDEFNNHICSSEQFDRSRYSEEIDIESPKMSLKFFNSPRCLKRSPKLDTKNIFKNMKQLKEQKKAEQNHYKCRKRIVETSILTSEFLCAKSEIKAYGVQTDNNSHNNQLGPNLKCRTKCSLPHYSSLKPPPRMGIAMLNKKRLPSVSLDCSKDTTPSEVVEIDSKHL